MTVTSHHFAGAADGLTGTRFGPYRKRASAVRASCTTIAWVVVIARCTNRCRIQSSGASITGVGALIVGKARVDAKVVHTSKAVGAGFNWARTVVLAKPLLDAPTIDAKVGVAALLVDTRIAVAVTIFVLEASLARCTRVVAVTSLTRAARVVDVTRSANATSLVLRARIVVSCAIVPVTRRFRTAD